MFCAIALQSIKLELPPFYILHDCIAIYYIGVTSLFMFCMIALQSIKLELPHKKGGNSNLIDCNAIRQHIKGR
jgi:hypothetical protein